mgnify:CR=1 FL=1
MLLLPWPSCDGDDDDDDDDGDGDGDDGDDDDDDRFGRKIKIFDVICLSTRVQIVVTTCAV